PGVYVANGGESDVVVFWSEGSSAFPESAVCWGYLRPASVTVGMVQPTSALIEIEGQKHIVYQGSRECSEGRFRHEARFPMKTHAVLSPWEGRPGTRVSDESRP